jgi:hypothetical protein
MENLQSKNRASVIWLSSITSYEDDAEDDQTLVLPFLSLAHCEV